MKKCAACGKPAEGNRSIHRDGFGIGPEVPLCDACGMHPTPTCPEIWAAIKARRQFAAELRRKKR